MKISFQEFKKKKEAQLNLSRKLSIILIGVGALSGVLLKTLDVLLAERAMFIIFAGAVSLLLVGFIIQLLVKIRCPKCRKDVAYKKGEFCCHCGCDFKEELQEIDELV